jgi:redox-sensitive bicupin YhaK (pirin superfamily)
VVWQAVEDKIGGRVCPMIFLEGMQEATSPFIMNVHHHHSFSSLDPLRALQRLVWPEGFPSHPHAGFNTLTYGTHTTRQKP